MTLWKYWVDRAKDWAQLAAQLLELAMESGSMVRKSVALWKTDAALHAQAMAETARRSSNEAKVISETDQNKQLAGFATLWGEAAAAWDQVTAEFQELELQTWRTAAAEKVVAATQATGAAMKVMRKVTEQEEWASAFDHWKAASLESEKVLVATPALLMALDSESISDSEEEETSDLQEGFSLSGANFLMIFKIT
eukprot:gnl/MRDRNA2_/MRDRNA2_84751_c0_seq1.p1 gnl/MRDRNA2_/MRDRNA2_84751_c0~~gnl/MRDRNA2_/MRDRNA2_84751_c0_seq1.p1  ORF type:complete len:196 (-),score=43.95 gnl/MRDRNA2_/MRDRNA2_84751_c0_seq1:48-635(-)